MAVKFFNIKTKEVRTVLGNTRETGPHIAALWNSSDRNPNAQQGQDMGWRIAPEVLMQIRDVRENQTLMMQIAQRNLIAVEDVDDKAILTYICNSTGDEHAPVAKDEDYTDEYNMEIRRQEKLRQERNARRDGQPATTDETATTTTTEPQTTTTTTEKPPTTTTATTKK